MNMFCYQCEQTARGQGCKMIGVCGKQPEVSALQDLLVFVLKGLGVVAHEARKAGIKDPAADAFMAQGLFSTPTNVNFDPERFKSLIRQAVQHREDLREKLDAAGGKAGVHCP